MFLFELLSFINPVEKEFEKIKNAIISIFELYSDENISSFSFKYPNFLLKFINFRIFSLDKKNINIIQDNDNTKYILNNITLIFKSEIEINNLKLSTIEFLLEINYDRFLIKRNDNFLNLEDIIPNSLYISENNHIRKLSYFDAFNNNQKATYFDENNKKFENIDIHSVFYDISKTLIFKKIINIQKSFNILTYDFDIILNNIIGKSYICSDYVTRIYKISSIQMENIEIPLKSINIKENILFIKDMNINGIFCYINTGLKIINFSINNMDNYCIFDKEHFNINLKEDKINYDGNSPPKNNVYEALKNCLDDFIKEEIMNYYSK